MLEHDHRKILLVYPKYPDTFWSFTYALRFISKKASSSPLGLLTVAAMLPEDWEKRFVDMNVHSLEDRDLAWADCVFISAMSIQKASAKTVIRRCRAMGVATVAGGPLFTIAPEEFQEVDHLVLNEAEVTLPLFLADLKKGCAKRLYTSNEWADIERTPVPDWGVVDMRSYASMNIQYSRGCPFSCEFCNITYLYGRAPRTKGKDQIVAELERLYELGWRGGVFFVDDNFIGNKTKLKKEVLPAIIEWMERRKHPFSFATEASVNVSDDQELMDLMVRAGFDSIFIGIETPNEKSLAECSKYQNKNRDLIACVKKIQKSGLQVQGGFIVGFDSDTASIFEKVTNFIQESGIVTAMVGLLNAPRGSRLYERLKKEGRLVSEISGDHMDLSMNFIPKMHHEVLVSGYRKILNTIYSPKHYYKRMNLFLREYKPLKRKTFHLHFNHVWAFFKTMFVLGIVGRERMYYWKILLWSLFKQPRTIPLTITLAIYGFHFRKVLCKVVNGKRS